VDRQPSRAVELVSNPEGVDAVVLCAGAGKRLLPLTKQIPKVLVKVGGRPLLAYHMEALRTVGIRRVVIVVGHMADSVKSYLSSESAFGLRVVYCQQLTPRGTGDAVLRASKLITSDPFIVSYGDVFVPNLSSVLTQLLAEAGPTIVAAQVDDTSEFGRIETMRGPDGPILARILEKDGNHRAGLVNAGLYALPRNIGKLLSETPVSERGEIELTAGIERAVAAGFTFRVHEIPRWVDVGTLDRLNGAEGMSTVASDLQRSRTG
jgi:NDP-sugar pyrophosphorylase family protein